jgi:hypothetical protein
MAVRIARTSALALLCAGLGVVAGVLCALRNASYVDEIDYCSIGAGSQKVCRRMFNS